MFRLEHVVYVSAYAPDNGKITLSGFREKEPEMWNEMHPNADHTFVGAQAEFTTMMSMVSKMLTDLASVMNYRVVTSSSASCTRENRSEISERYCFLWTLVKT